ncbi:MAG: sugar transferase [Candidatus Moranbacteria bacterium]|nr:sugar transferase [Candidatus Moranbacteria bacterium]
MKKSELVFSIIQVFVDLLMILLAATLAYWLRSESQVQELIKKEGLYNLSTEQFMQIVYIIAPLILVVYAFEGLYNIRATRKFFKEGYSVFKATTVVLVLIMIGFFLQREWFSSRFIIVAAWMLIISLVMSGRLLLQLIQRALLVFKGIGHHRVLIIGLGEKVKNVKETIIRRPRLGYRVVGFIDHINILKIKEIRKNFGIDEVIVHESSVPDDLLLKLYDYCEINNITYKLIPSLRQAKQFKVNIFNGEPIIEINHTPLDGWGKIAKRIFDIIGSSVLILFTSPIMLIVIILIKSEDPKGPIVFKNARVGADGKEIFVYKFRYFQWKWCTTKKNPNYENAIKYEQELIENSSERVGPIYKIVDDPRRTQIGKFLEKFSIDEFPQFFNVFKGDMSLVGPRPHQEREVNKYNEYHRRLLTITPGITGMAQISGRSDLDFEDEYKLDVYYIENWSLFLDIVILIKTPFSLLKSRRNN